MGKPVAVYDAMGGPDTPFTDPGGKHSGGPTHPGKYTLHSATQHVSSSWPYSRIVWGAPLKEDPATNDVLYQDRHGKWHSVRARVFDGNKSVNVPDELKDVNFRYISGRYELPATWIFNDFGHTTWYMFKDLDGDGKLNPKKGEKIHNEFIHTTPKNEFQSKEDPKSVVLEHSHGCVHVKPLDIDEMKAKGYLKAGNLFIVHKGTDKPAVTVAAEDAAKKYKRYELHFFPGLNQIVVYGY